MQRKVVLYIAMSLDGYIATNDDSLDWLFKTEGEGDNGYSEFYDTVDTVLMGRRTYDWIIEKENGNFPYTNKDCYVFSNTLSGRNENVEYVSENIAGFVNKLMKMDGKNIWVVGGGELLLGFLKERLVDEFIISIAPTIIGKGIPLFQEMDCELELKLLNVRRFNQFVELHYILK